MFNKWLPFIPIPTLLPPPQMITGDHPDTARTIGSWIGITTQEVLTGTVMEAMDDVELEEHVDK